MLTTVPIRSFARNPFRAIDEVMNLVARDFANGSCCAVNAPAALAVDIREREKEYLVEASVPGFRKDEVDVQMHEGVLSISANRQESNETIDEGWIRRERSTTNLSRQVRLPEGVTSDGIRADLSDGVLTVRIPKPAQLQPRKISIG
ncbi:MAG: Hsp20/alpha crystallin family protein [Phycisphaerae bacterium]|nr:Hsp20/alpha crystallin family protein [Phycisphaerae bacterium]